MYSRPHVSLSQFPVARSNLSRLQHPQDALPAAGWRLLPPTFVPCAPAWPPRAISVPGTCRKPEGCPKTKQVHCPSRGAGMERAACPEHLGALWLQVVARALCGAPWLHALLDSVGPVCANLWLPRGKNRGKNLGTELSHGTIGRDFPWFFFQHALQVLPRHGGPPVPLHLAAHLHPRAAAFHDRHRVLAHPLPHRPALQLPAPPEGAPGGGGEPCSSQHFFQQAVFWPRKAAIESHVCPCCCKARLWYHHGKLPAAAWWLMV